MERERFLAALRARLAVPAPANMPHPIAAVDEVPQVGYPRDLSDPAAAFAEVAAGLGTNVRRGEVGEVLGEVIEAHGVRTAVLSSDPEVDGVDAVLRSMGVDVGGDPAAADLGVTGALCAIAATGTLVLDSSRAGGRSKSLLPPVHLAIVRADGILPHAGELFRAEDFGGRLPSQLVLASGPSRSADIELTLTVGVHGPRHVWVAII